MIKWLTAFLISLAATFFCGFRCWLQKRRLSFSGRSWSPFGKIAKVEYSLDQGKSWQAARLRETNIAAAWARWDFDWEPKPGKHAIRVRATDEKGNVQPDKVPFNQQGYLFNAMVDQPITIT